MSVPPPGLVRALPPKPAPKLPPQQPPPREATRMQRTALILGLLAAAAAMLWLFSSILVPFVVAAGIAYFLDPVTTRLARSGMPRGLAALLMVVALVAACLIVALLLYPLLLSQLGILIARVPVYVGALRGWAGQVVAHLQDRLGTEYVNANLRDLVAGQAGAMLGFVAGALTRIVGGGFALFNVLSLAVITPVVAFYLLRDWPRAVARLDGWLPRRYAGALRAQAREVDRILSAWLRGQALCCLLLAVFYAVALQLAGLDLGLIVGISSGLLSFIPYVGTITGGLTSIGLAFAQFPDWRGVRHRRGGVRDGAAPGRLRDLSSLPGRPGGAARSLGNLRAVRGRRRVRVSRRAARGADRGDARRARPLLAPPLSREPALSRPAYAAVNAQP